MPPVWAPCTHQRFDADHRAAVYATLLCHHRRGTWLHTLPTEILLQAVLPQIEYGAFAKMRRRNGGEGGGKGAGQRGATTDAAACSTHDSRSTSSAGAADGVARVAAAAASAVGRGRTPRWLYDEGYSGSSSEDEEDEEDEETRTRRTRDIIITWGHHQPGGGEGEDENADELGPAAGEEQMAAEATIAREEDDAGPGHAHGATADAGGTSYAPPSLAVISPPPPPIVLPTSSSQMDTSSGSGGGVDEAVDDDDDGGDEGGGEEAMTRHMLPRRSSA